jgi:CAAX prenyl protease-like protein
MFLFLLLTSAESLLPTAPPSTNTNLSPPAHPTFYPAFYALKILAVSALAWACRNTWTDLKPNSNPKSLLLGAAVGALVALLWIALDGHYPSLPLLGSRAAFNPDSIPNPAGRFAFLAVRAFGLVALVPLFEELFWRSFLVRYIDDPTDFQRIPIGQLTWTSALVTSGLFALAHPEWLPALLTGLAWAALLRQTRSLGACLASHVTANLILGIFVLATKSWHFV